MYISHLTTRTRESRGEYQARNQQEIDTGKETRQRNQICKERKQAAKSKNRRW